MSTQINTALIKGFETGVTHLAQQEGSRLRNHVDVRMVGPGEEFAFDQLGSADPSELATRHADTPIGNIAHDRRWAVPKTYARGELIDKPDALKTINSFANPYTRALAMGFGRKMDSAIITAASATALTGKTSATSSESFDTTNNRIAHGSEGMTLAKITETAYILSKYEHRKPWTMVVSAYQIRDMMNDTTFTSADYNSIRCLMTGEINTFMGFTWVQTELLTLASSVRTCLAWSNESMLLAMLENPMARITERDDKNFSVQVYYRSQFGSTRMQQHGVVEVQAYES